MNSLPLRGSRFTLVAPAPPFGDTLRSSDPAGLIFLTEKVDGGTRQIGGGVLENI